MVKISVIIPVYNRKNDLIRALKSIYDSDYEDFEVIVVDDGSKEDLKEIKDLFPQLVFIRQANSGPGIARNTGVEYAKGSILAFTDSDCVVSKDWLKSIDKSFRKGVGIVGGRTIEDKEKGILGILYVRDGQVIANSEIYSPTNNLAVSKKVFEEVGGFDPYFFFAGEDVDFCFRAKQKGHTIMPQEDMVINHHHPGRFKGLLIKKYNYEQGLVQIIEKHPNYKRFCPYYTFIMPLTSLRDSVSFIKSNKKSILNLPLLWYIFFMSQAAGFVGKLSYIFKERKYKYILYVPYLRDK